MLNAEAALALLLVLAFGWALRERSRNGDIEHALRTARSEMFDARTRQRLAEDRLAAAMILLEDKVEGERIS